MKRPIVWVIKEQVQRDAVGPKPIDYTPAMQYGDLEFITEFDLPVHTGESTLAKRWNAQTKKFIDLYDDGKDFIILTGQPVAFFMVGYALSTSNKAPRFLVWRREEGKYVPFVPKVDLFPPVIV